MEKVVTQLRGIERNTDVELSKDGGMLDLINMRYREDGSLEPMGQPSVAGNLGDGSIPLYIHYLPNGDANLICAVVSSGTMMESCTILCGGISVSMERTKSNL